MSHIKKIWIDQMPHIGSLFSSPLFLILYWHEVCSGAGRSLFLRPG